MRLAVVGSLIVLAACGGREKMDGSASARRLEDSDSVMSLTGGVATGPSSRAPTVLFLGTSLTAGFGLGADHAFPAVVARLAKSDGLTIKAVNAGLSGETSAGALRRVEWLTRTPADVFVIETGANDGLRALPIESTRSNIEQLVRRIQIVQPAARVLLVQMEAPPNFGPDYSRRFHDMYGSIARSTGVALVPFLLEGVAGIPELNQADAIHPNVAGAERAAATVWRGLRPVVQTLATH